MASYPWPTWVDTDEVIVLLDDRRGRIETNGPTIGKLTVPATEDALAQLVVAGNEGTYAVRGATPRNIERLGRFSEHRAPLPALVTAELGSPEVAITVYQFPFYRRLDGPLRLGVDERLAEAVSRRAEKRLDAADAADWLSTHFAASTPGTDVLLLASHIDPAAPLRGGMQLHGREATAHMTVRPDDGAVLLDRITPAAGRNARLEDTLQLISGDVAFVEAGYASRVEALWRRLSSEEDSTPATTGRYMETWRHYEDEEARLVLGAARRIGSIRYSTAERRSDERWELILALPADVERIAAIEDAKFDRLALYPSRPAWLDPAPDVSPSVQIIQAAPPATSARVISAHGGAVIVDVDVRSGRSVPPTGVLTVSLAGHAAQVRRRAVAQDALTTHPDLQLVLADQNVELPGGVRRRLPKPLPPAVLRAFDGRQPNASQLAALKLAYESGGLVAIQGPPGTGKTSVVAALEQLYAGQSAGRERASAVLVSATQHDAVDNVLDKSAVFGLPAIKHGRRRDEVEQTHLERISGWARARAQHVEHRLAEIEGGALADAILRTAHLARGYLAAAMPPDETARLLVRLQEAAGPYGDRLLSGRLRDELADLATELARESGNVSVAARRRTQTLRRAAALIRTSPPAHADDGAIAALQAQVLLRHAGALDPATSELLGSAAADEEIDFHALEEVRARILDEASASGSLARRAVRDDRATALVSEALEELNRRLAATPSGRAQALARYRERLRDDFRAVEQALSNYLTVVGATAQGSATLEDLLPDDVDIRLVVVDEAARANPLDLLIPLVKARECKVVVGDHRQLPQLVDQELVGAVSTAKGLTARDLLEMSLFERLYQRLHQSRRAVTLREQYRMHPLIGEFVSGMFYPENERFLSPRPAQEFSHELRVPGYERRVVRWLEVPPSRELRNKSISRPEEAEVVVGDLCALVEDDPSLSFALISMYSDQVSACWKLLARAGIAERTQEGWQVIESYRYCRDREGEELSDRQGRWIHRLRVGTVDAFQGREFDVVFVSLVRSNDAPNVRQRFGFTLSPNRLNVAMSRAKRLLVVAGDAGTFTLDVTETEPIREFIALCASHEQGLQ